MALTPAKEIPKTDGDCLGSQKDRQTPTCNLSKKRIDISEIMAVMFWWFWTYSFKIYLLKFSSSTFFNNALCPRCCLHGSAASLCLHPLWAPLCLPSLCSGHHPHGTKMSYLPGPGRSRRVDDRILPFFPKNLSCFWDHLAIPVACRWCASWELWTHEDHEARARPACLYGSMEAHLGYDWRRSRRLCIASALVGCSVEQWWNKPKYEHFCF